MLRRVQRFVSRAKYACEQVRITYLYAKSGVKFRQPTSVEKQLIFGVQQLIEAGYPIWFDAAHESWISRSFPTGDFDVKYTYEFEANADRGRFSLVTHLEVAHDEPSAIEIFQEGVAAMSAGAAKVGARFVFKGNLQNWSDNAFVGFTLAGPKERVVGCLLSFQREKMVYTINLSGVLLEDAHEIEEIVYPFLQASLEWSRDVPNPSFNGTPNDAR